MLNPSVISAPTELPPILNEIIQYPYSVFFPSQFPTIAEAVDHIKNLVVSPGASITLEIESGVHEIDPLQLVDLRMPQLILRGQGAALSGNVSGTASVSGSVGAYEVAVNTAVGSNFQAGDVILIRSLTATGAAAAICGAWLVVGSTPSSVTFACTSRGTLPASITLPADAMLAKHATVLKSASGDAVLSLTRSTIGMIQGLTIAAAPGQLGLALADDSHAASPLYFNPFDFSSFAINGGSTGLSVARGSSFHGCAIVSAASVYGVSAQESSRIYGGIIATGCGSEGLVVRGSDVQIYGSIGTVLAGNAYPGCTAYRNSRVVAQDAKCALNGSGAVGADLYAFDCSNIIAHGATATSSPAANTVGNFNSYVRK